MRLFFIVILIYCGTVNWMVPLAGWFNIIDIERVNIYRYFDILGVTGIIMAICFFYMLSDWGPMQESNIVKFYKDIKQRIAGYRFNRELNKL